MLCFNDPMKGSQPYLKLNEIEKRRVHAFFKSPSSNFYDTTLCFKTLKRKPFENNVGTGENAGDQHFLLFQHCFLPKVPFYSQTAKAQPHFNCCQQIFSIRMTQLFFVVRQRVKMPNCLIF